MGGQDGCPVGGGGGRINCAAEARLRELGQAPAAELGTNDECCPTSPIRSPLPSACRINQTRGTQSSLGRPIQGPRS